MSLKRFSRFGKQSGGSAVEFALLLPIWLFFFFGLLDYGWYLTNLMVLENAVASGARAGVKVKYWLEESDPNFQDPREVATTAAENGFWLGPPAHQGICNR